MSVSASALCATKKQMRATSITRNALAGWFARLAASPHYSVMNDFTSQVARFVGRHFLTLSCVQHPPNNGAERVLVFSGFVVEITGEWFYVTAGHILRDIRHAQESGYSFDVWRLGDQTAGNKFNNTAVPYDFQLNDWLVLEDSANGLDYAAVHIAPFYRRQLEAGGVIAISASAWGNHLMDHDHWMVVGIPSETVSYDGVTNIAARLVIVPLSPVSAPASAAEKARNQFYAQIADGSEQFVKDMDGMSGGPVFMLKKSDGSWKYGVIGVQSGWYPIARVVTACPFGSFAHALEDVVKQAVSSYAQLCGPDREM